MDLKPDTQTPLSQVLAGKGRGTSTLSVPPDMTVAGAVEVLNRHQIGSVLVLDGGKLVGIFTERDILRRVVGELARPRDHPGGRRDDPRPRGEAPDVVDVSH